MADAFGSFRYRGTAARGGSSTPRAVSALPVGRWVAFLASVLPRAPGTWARYGDRPRTSRGPSGACAEWPATAPGRARHQCSAPPVAHVRPTIASSHSPVHGHACGASLLPAPSPRSSRCPPAAAGCPGAGHGRHVGPGLAPARACRAAAKRHLARGRVRKACRSRTPCVARESSGMVAPAGAALRRLQLLHCHFQALGLPLRSAYASPLTLQALRLMRD